MATPESLWGGICAAVIGIVFSIILLLAFGLSSEAIMAAFEGTPVLSEGGTIFDVASPWNMGYDDASFWMTMLYILSILPALLGIMVMFVSAIKTQEYDVFTDGQAGYGGQAVPQYVSAEEIAFRRGL